MESSLDKKSSEILYIWNNEIENSLSNLAANRICQVKAIC